MPIELKSEFAHIRVELDVSGNGPRLLVTDLKTNRHAFIDLLVLEGLVAADPEVFEAIVDPSQRWMTEEVVESNREDRQVSRILRGINLG